MSMTETYPQLLASLDDLRRQWRLRQVVTGILLTFAGATAVLAAVVAADNLFHLGTAGRLLLAVLLWGSLAAAVLTFIIRRFLEDRRDDFFAVLVEQKYPELRNQLINALQLGRGSINGFSPRLIEAIVDDAARATADMEMANSLDSRPVKRAGLIALVAVIVIAGYAVAFPLRFANGLERILLPLADKAPYTETQVVSVKPGKTRVPEGASITVEARVQGRIPETATLHRQTKEGSSQAFLMQSDHLVGPEGTATFSFTMLQVAESFHYYVEAGDGRSAEYRVEVVKRPRIENRSLTYRLPAYTAQPERSVPDADGEISGIAGTAVDFELKASKPLANAMLVTEGGESIALERGGDDSVWRTSFVIWSKDAKPGQQPVGRLVVAPTRYQVKLTDTEGYENADPLWHSITLTKDQPPTVVLTAPGRDLQVKPGATVGLSVESRDDFGIADVRIIYRINDEQQVRELKRFPHEGPPACETTDQLEWKLSTGGPKPGDLIQYWAIATDRNTITGPGQGESRRFTIFLLTPEIVAAALDLHVQDYAQILEELIRLQRENRAQTASGVAFDTLVIRQALIRAKTRQLARAMEKDAVPIATMIKSLDDLVAGLMASAVKLLESGKETNEPAKAASFRNDSLRVQDKIIAELEALLARLQRNEQAKRELRKLEKKDQAAHKAITKTLEQMIKDMDKLLKDQTELASKFEKLPKKPVDELKEEKLKDLKDFQEFLKRTEKWAKGSVNELTKLPTGFVDDFDLRKDVNKIYEEIEKAATRPKADKLEVSLEDLGAGLATKMKEDLEMWMSDTPDALKWVLEEPLNKKPMKIPEMPLPKDLEDMIGDLLQKAEEFDEEADDITSAWGDNLDQAGWGVSDGPISNFSAKGKTGNDLPNNMEVTGRSGDGRRGKSAGQMMGDTSRALQGRKTPARVGNERYEPGKLKQEAPQDPNGATGGGKKSGAGRKGLQGGTPPDLVRDMGRLSEKQAGVREKAEQVARKLDTMGITSKRLTESIELMKSVENDLKNTKYEDAARRRRVALTRLRTAMIELDKSTAAQLSRARDLPPQLRQELLQAADEGYPAGYESILKSYFKALSESEK